jgi:HEAT repeat protein
MGPRRARHVADRLQTGSEVRMTMKRLTWRKHLGLLGLFLIATLVLTYPTAFRLSDSLPDLGDPFVYTWALAWEGRQALRLDFGRFFDGNVFYPAPGAVLYADHLLGWQPLTLPIYALTGNVVLAHNVALLAATVLGGYFMYLLVRYLTGSGAAGVFAGLAFAFVPYRFQHWGHLPRTGFFWMPLCLYFLHRFIGSVVSGGRRSAISGQRSAAGDPESEIPNLRSEIQDSESEIQHPESEIQKMESPRPQTPNPRPQVRWGVAAGAAFAMQALTGLYEGVYLALLGALFAVLLVPASGAWRRGRFWVGAAAGVAVAVLGVSWSILAYARTHQALGLERRLSEVEEQSATVADYLVVPPTARLLSGLGWTTQVSERTAWLGLVVAAQALLGLAAGLFAAPKRRDAVSDLAMADVPQRPSGSGSAVWTVITGVVMAALLAGVAAFLCRGYVPWDVVGWIPQPLRKPVLGGLVVLIGVTHLVGGLRRLRAAAQWVFRPVFFYVSGAVLFWFLSLGPTVQVTPARVLGRGPYLWLYEHVPGFMGMRVPARMSVMVSLCLTVLGGMGVAAVARRFSRPRARAVYVALTIALMLVEFCPAPTECYRVPLTDDARALCRWLAEQADAPVVCHFPFPCGPGRWHLQSYPMHLSTFHWQRMVNGYSGFQPPLQGALCRRLSEFPQAAALHALQALGVRYAIFDADPRWGDSTAPALLGDPPAPPVRRFGSITVFEVTPPGCEPVVRRSGESPAEVELRFLLRLLTMTEDEAEFRALSEDLRRACLRIRKPEEGVQALAAAAPQVGPKARAALVYVLHQLSTAAAARVLVTMLEDPSPVVRREILRALSGDWRDWNAAPDLLRALGRLDEPRERHQTLRTFVALVLHPRRPSKDEAVTLLEQAMPMCRNASERGSVVAAFGYVESLSSLKALERYLGDGEAEVRNKAAFAVSKIAPALATKHAAAVRAALEAALRATPDEPVADVIREAIDALSTAAAHSSKL